MNWYCALTHHLLNKNNIKVRDENESFQSIQKLLEVKLIELYKAILFYQMKSVCSYYKHQGLIFLQDLTNWNDWDVYLKSVTDAEDTLRKDSAQHLQEYVKTALGGLVELAGTWEEPLRSIQQAIQDQIYVQGNMYKDEKTRKYFEDLSVVIPEEDMKRIERKKGGLLNDVYKWILDTEQYAAFTNWGDDKSNSSPCRLLWIKGLAGMGKTMLLIGLIRELSDRLAGLAPSISYFFCQGTDDTAQNSATAILRSLVWMLLLQQPDLIEYLRLEHERVHKDSLFSDNRYALDAISRVFKNMLSDPHLSEVYFIVDALDECNEGLGDLFQLISTSFKLSKRVKWLVSSRPDVNVLAQSEIQGVENLDDIVAVLDLNAQNLGGPIKAYIEHKLSTLEGRDGYTQGILKKLSDEIHQRAKKTFLWVALVFKELDEVDRNRKLVHGSYALKIIKLIPSGLSELYGHMMTRIEEGLFGDPQYCKTILVIIIFAHRPLSLSELAVLAGLQPETDPESQTIVAKCGSFLTIDKETVYLIHQSAKEYLETNYKSRLQQSGATQGHIDISRRSIDAMSKRLKKNIFNFPHVGFNAKDVLIPSPDSLEGLRYCCVYWVQHLQQSDTQIHDNDQVHQFLKVNLLHWLEALSWMGKISEGILAILLLEAQIQVSFVSYFIQRILINSSQG